MLRVECHLDRLILSIMQQHRRTYEIEQTAPSTLLFLSAFIFHVPVQTLCQVYSFRCKNVVKVQANVSVPYFYHE